MFRSNTQSNQRWARKKGFALALAISNIVAFQAIAQESPKEEEDIDGVLVEEVIVRGMRQSVQSAQELKRNSSVVIDSIVAKDMGDFPDKSVAEALQRVPGVTVEQFASTSDTQHFAAEPSTVLIRGLTMVRTEFNGRDSFSANSSRGLSWSDISPELMAGVDTYKNSMAELIEGGIAGTVNMRTRVPFDYRGFTARGTIAANYNDVAEEVTPDASLLLSNRWDLDFGEVGLMGNVAYSDVTSASQGVQYGRFVPYYNVFNEGQVNFIPEAINMRDATRYRERVGTALAAQWKSNDESLVVTTQFNHSEYENRGETYTASSSPGFAPQASESIFFTYDDSGQSPHNFVFADGSISDGHPTTYIGAAPGSDPFVFGSNGVLETGTLVRRHEWSGTNAGSAARGVIADGRPIVERDNTLEGYEQMRGSDVFAITNSGTTTNVTQDFSFNVKWSINDRMRANFDVQKIDSTVKAWDIEMGFGSFADLKLDLRGKAAVEWLAPTNVNFSEGGWANPNNWYLRHIMDHFEDSEGDELAVRADYEIDFNVDHLESIKVGVRFSDRDQTVRSSNYNWEAVATSWSSNQAHYFNLDRHEPGPVEPKEDKETGEVTMVPVGTNENQPGFTGYPEGYYEVRDFNGDYFDLGIGSGQLPFADVDLLQDRWRMINQFGGPALGFTDGLGWEPACSGLGDRADEINSDLCVTPAELVEVSEETSAAYIQFNIGGDNSTIFGVPYSGNVGVRYVYTNVKSVGGWAISPIDDLYWVAQEGSYESEVGIEVPGTDRELACGDRPEGEPGAPRTMGCYISVEDALFFDGADQITESDANHHNILPSLNLKFEFTDELVGRIGLNRAMSRPDMGYLRNFYRLSPVLPTLNNEDDPLWIKNESGEIVGARVEATGSGQNAYLKPITADQIDLTLGWYFDDDGSLSGAVFYKDLDNYIQHVRFDTEVESNGVTKQATIRAPINGDGAEIQGLELSFTDFFDFLPIDGFGIKANYTYVENKGLQTSYASSSNVSGEFENTLASSNVEVDALRGLSNHAFNFITMYEGDAWSAKLAYNWRSEFLMTPIDSVIGRPMWQDDFGTLDGSLKFNPMDGLTISLKASNLLNSEVVLKQQMTNSNGDSGIVTVPNDTRLAGSWFQKGRRFTLSASYKF